MMTRSLFALCCVWAAACSDTPGGPTSGSGTDGQPKNEQICTGSFCVDADVRIGVSPNKLLFVDVAPGTVVDRQLTVTHIGNNSTLRVSAATFDPPSGEFQVVDFATFDLAAGKSHTLTVRYTPKAAGSKKLNLVLANNDKDANKRKLAVPVEVAAGQALLQVMPDPIDFGNVAGGSSPTIEASLVNIGTLDMHIVSIEISKSGTTDFVIDKMPDIAQPLPANGNVPITLRYTPTGGDFDQSSLLVETKDGKKYKIGIQGNEIAARIQVVPPKVNLGEMELNKAATAQVKICNTGMAPLEVSGFELAPVSQLKDLAWDIKLPVTVPPPKVSGSCDTGVLFTLTGKTKTPLPSNGSPVASILISSNDKAQPIYNLMVFAQTNAPKILVTPGDYVDFAFVGKGVKSKRTVQVFNEGSSPLDVTKIEITDEKDKLGEFTIVPGNFAPTNGSAATLQPGSAAQSFEVQFEAKGPVEQKASAKLHIYSNDPGTPDVVLPMYAERKDGTVCKVAMVPPVVNFGLLPYGNSKTLPVTFKNVGTGYCKFKEVHAVDCIAPLTLPLAGLPPPQPKCSTAKTLFMTAAPSTTLFKLGPGDTGKLQVTFSAPEGLASLFETGAVNKVTDFGGLLVATFEDDSTGGLVTVTDVKLSDPTAVSKAKPNLVAKVGKAAVSVMPGNLEFGVVTVGCKSPGKDVMVFNTGTTEAFVNKLELSGCGLEVVGVAWPAIPKTGYPISQAKPATFKVQYAPQNVGKDQCQLMIYTSLNGVCTKADGAQTGKDCTINGDCAAGEFCAGQLFTVPMTGEGTLDKEWTDEFEQGVGKQSDVLFVVDNSGSMSEEQQNLASNFKQFTQIADIWSTNYHIGVVTTDMAAADQSGKLRLADGIRVVTPKSPNGGDTLQKMTKPGSGGSGNEQGLAAAEAALTAPLVTDTGQKCTADADCKQAGGQCIPNADDTATKMCGGTNRTFLRKNAGLEIVIVSDEEDGSSNDVNYYINFLYSIKGFANKNLFHLHAIVGPGGGCKGPGGEAEGGERYIKIAQATGGKFGSICDGNFAKVLKDIGTVAFGLAQQFFLTRNPEPATIVVKVNGKPCPPPGWQYDAPSNSVIFPDGSACMPQKGDKISIYYKMLCNP
ncbi:MAG: choice-of-anchor D domain-containing protein [Deltaproteobacteria bacterium]|nr:choice-of-anchor D domain-containing protein [Deltaproteobacteria bacterium]